MIKAIIFDFDELMVNHIDYHLQSSIFACKQFGIDSSDLSDANPQYMGMRVSDIMRDIMHRKGADMSQFDDVLAVRQKEFLRLVGEKVIPMPGLFYAIDVVRSLHLKYAVASSGIFAYVTECLKQLNLANFFDVIVSGEDLDKGKPDPQTFLVAAQKLGVHPNECVVIEDAQYGIKAAKAAGMYCIAIPYHGNGMDHTQDISAADIELNSLNDITKEIFSF